MKKQAKRKPAARAATKPSKPKNVKLLKKKKLEPRLVRGKPAAPPPKSPELLEKERRAKQATEQYESAVRLFQEQKYEKAKGLFEKVAGAGWPEMADRARVYLNACNQRLERQATQARTPEEHYNLAVTLINARKLDEAEPHLQKTLKAQPRADHAYYALATLQALKGDIESSLGSLKTAIEIEPRNRYLARNDHDFAALTEDPRFADLAYPEKNGS